MIELTHQFKSMDWINSANQSELAAEIEPLKAYLTERLLDTETSAIDDEDFQNAFYYWGLLVRQLKSLG